MAAPGPRVFLPGGGASLQRQLHTATLQAAQPWLTAAAPGGHSARVQEVPTALLAARHRLCPPPPPVCPWPPASLPLCHPPASRSWSTGVVGSAADALGAGTSRSNSVCH